VTLATSGLNGLANFRDLGGSPAAEAMGVRRGRVYRSAMLDPADPILIKQLRLLSLNTIVDLRANGERRDFPTPWKEIGCSDYWFHDHLSGTGNLDRLLEKPSADGAAALREGMIAMYRAMPMAQERSYRTLFTKLAAAQTPLLFHCAAGKDRTGVAAALVLAALNVPRDLILEDYLRTNAFDLRATVWAQASSSHPTLQNASDDLLRPLLAADVAYLDAMFDELNSNFGSVENYLRRALGIGGHELDQIHQHLLEPAGV
jgi:protein-tyrosine phosphatase